MSVRIAGRSYELLSASTSLSDDEDVPVDASITRTSLSDEDNIPVDASITSAPPAYEEDEGEETIYFDTRDEVVHPESDDLLEEAAAAAVNGLVDGAVLAVAVGAVADAAHLEGTSDVIASSVLEAARRSLANASTETVRTAIQRLGLSRRQVLMSDSLQIWCRIVYEEREDCSLADAFFRRRRCGSALALLRSRCSKKLATTQSMAATVRGLGASRRLAVKRWRRKAVAAMDTRALRTAQATHFLQRWHASTQKRARAREKRRAAARDLNRRRLQRAYEAWARRARGDAVVRMVSKHGRGRRRAELLKRCVVRWRTVSNVSISCRLLRGDVSQRMTRDAFADWRRGARARREARAQNVRALYHWARQLEGKCFEALSRYAQNRKAKRLDVERAFYERARATETKAAADLVETTRSRPEPRWTPDVSDDTDARWTATFLLPRDAPPRSIPSPPNTPSPVKIRPPPKRRAAPRPLPPDVVLLGEASMPPVARAAPDDDGEASLAPTARRPPVTGPAPPASASPSSDPAAVDVLVQALARAVGELRPEAPPLLRPTTLEGTPPPPPPSLRSARSHRSASSRSSRRSRRSSQRREAQGEVTVLEHRLAALAREKAAWRRRVRRREAPRGAYDEWRRGMESDVRACVERIEEIGCASIEEEVW